MVKKNKWFEQGEDAIKNQLSINASSVAGKQ